MSALSGHSRWPFRDAEQNGIAIGVCHTCMFDVHAVPVQRHTWQRPKVNGVGQAVVLLGLLILVNETL